MTLTSVENDALVSKNIKRHDNFWTKTGNFGYSGKAGPLTVCISQLVERSLFEDKG